LEGGEVQILQGGVMHSAARGSALLHRLTAYKMIG